MGKKAIIGDRGDDPEWIKDIAFHVSTYQKSKKSDEYNRQLRGLFLEYRIEGLRPKEAWEKARRILAAFRIEK